MAFRYDSLTRGSLHLGGIKAPRFSVDGSRVYFVATSSEIKSAVYVLKLSTRGLPKLLCTGKSIEVVYSGAQTGHLIVLLDRPGTSGSSEYWLVSPAGEPIESIGTGEMQLQRFKEAHGIR